MCSPLLREPFWLIKFKLLHLFSHVQIFFSVPISPSTSEQARTTAFPKKQLKTPKSAITDPQSHWHMSHQQELGGKIKVQKPQTN